MRKVENTQWNTEADLNLNQDNDLNYSEEGWFVLFNYNGYKLHAVINFDINFYITGDEETNSLGTDVLDVTIDVRELYYGSEEIAFPTKDVIDIQNQLAIDLKTQY